MNKFLKEKGIICFNSQLSQTVKIDHLLWKLPQDICKNPRPLPGWVGGGWWVRVLSFITAIFVIFTLLTLLLVCSLSSSCDSTALHRDWDRAGAQYIHNDKGLLRPQGSQGVRGVQTGLVSTCLRWSSQGCCGRQCEGTQRQAFGQ